MAGASFDSSELRAFAADLTSAGNAIAPAVRGIVAKGAVNIKKQMVEEMKSSTHFKGVARAISYDIKAEANAVEAQIGPSKGSPGSLANIAYFGTPRGGGTVPDPQLALEAEMPNFERYINAAIDGTL